MAKMKETMCRGTRQVLEMSEIHPPLLIFFLFERKKFVKSDKRQHKSNTNQKQSDMGLYW